MLLTLRLSEHLMQIRLMIDPGSDTPFVITGNPQNLENAGIRFEIA